MLIGTSEARDLIYESVNSSVSSNFSQTPSEWGEIREKLRNIQINRSGLEWDLEAEQKGASFTYSLNSEDYRIEGKVKGLVEEYL